MNDKNIMHERIKQLRRAAGMTQSELAQKLGVSRSYVAGWESGSRAPNMSCMERMTKLFGVSSDYIYGISDRKYNIVSTNELELDLTKLNNRGVILLRDLYRMIKNTDEYKA